MFKDTPAIVRVLLYFSGIWFESSHRRIPPSLPIFLGTMARAMFPIALLACPFVAASSSSLRGAGCSGEGLLGGLSPGSSETTLSAPICYGGQLLLETFSIKVLSFDGKHGVVDMKAVGPQSGECIGSEFQTNDNKVTIDDKGCLGDSEYEVRYCPDQDHFIVKVEKPVEAEVILASQPCPEGEI